MFAYSENFITAIKDYESFLSKKYPQKAILKLVGDRYRLSSIERAMLYRGVVPLEIAARRQHKMASETQLKNEILHIDAYNQLLTIGCYLKGQPVIISIDGMLRDAQEMHGKGAKDALHMRAVEIVISYLLQAGVAGVRLYFDSQVTGLENFHDKLNATLHDFVLLPDIVYSDHVDKELVSINEGIIATSDSVIIDNSSNHIFDLARSTIEFHFSPKFFDLRQFLKE